MISWGDQALFAMVQQPRRPAAVVRERSNGAIGASFESLSSLIDHRDVELIGALPATFPEWLGDRSFQETHGTRFAYIGGAMANGIASVEMVIALGNAGCLGFFGAAGLSLARVDAEILRIKQALDPLGLPWGVNLIHSPAEPSTENGLVDLFFKHGVMRVEASAFMAMSPAIVRYAATGLTRDANGKIRRRYRVIGKISREEVARRFLEPPQPNILQKLVAAGQLSAAEAELAAQLPVADDLTCEADSGGHTDNRALSVLLPNILRLRDRISAERGYTHRIRIGAAGGLGAPAAIAASFAMGAAYVQTGSVNQACVESGLHASGRAMLANAGMADVMMAPAADMFEMGVEVQVLKRGTLFAPRAKKLYELYRSYDSFAAIPKSEQEKIESVYLKQSFADAWASTREFWLKREPKQVERAMAEPKHQMALVFRSYLGLASRWAIDGIGERESDFQIWCGPAMGAFNSWVKGSFLEAADARTVAQVALNLLEGALHYSRAQQLRSFGVPVPEQAFEYRPRAIELA